MGLMLRDYQKAAVDAVWGYFNGKTGNPLVALPTGTGKSLVIGGFIHSVFQSYSGINVWMLTHVKKLIQQNFTKLLEYWPTAPAGIYSAGLKRRETNNPILFGGIGSVINVAHLLAAPDLLVIDEAHLVSPENETMYRRLIDALLKRNPKMKVIGLSATCYRMGLGSLTEGGIFTDICFDMTGMEAFNWLVQQGHLAPLHAIRANYRYDVGNVPIVNGDYVKSALQEAANHRDINEIVLDEIAQHASQRNRWMIFATGIKHVDALTEILNVHGIDTVGIHSKLDPGEHDELLDAFTRGQVRCAISMDELTTGVDIPEVDYIGMLRTTQSTNRWVQMLGRGTRPAPWVHKLDCLVGDFTTNSSELGPINDPVLPCPPRERKKGSVAPTAPIKECPGRHKTGELCKSFIHASLGTCPHCQHIFATPVHLLTTPSGVEVMRLDDPIVEPIDVMHVTYNVHHKRNGIDSMLVTYHCRGEDNGDIPRRFKDYVCFEHEGKARMRAHNWWRERCVDIPPPDTVQRAIDLSHKLRIPKRVLVWINRSQPEIQSYVY
jgi:DNA repair protein RadD